MGQVIDAAAPLLAQAQAEHPELGIEGSTATSRPMLVAGHLVTLWDSTTEGLPDDPASRLQEAIDEALAEVGEDEADEDDEDDEDE